MRAQIGFVFPTRSIHPFRRNSFPTRHLVLIWPICKLALFRTIPRGGAVPTAHRVDKLALFYAVAHVCHPRHPSFNPQSEIRNARAPQPRIGFVRTLGDLSSANGRRPERCRRPQACPRGELALDLIGSGERQTVVATRRNQRPIS